MEGGLEVVVDVGFGGSKVGGAEESPPGGWWFLQPLPPLDFIANYNPSLFSKHLREAIVSFLFLKVSNLLYGSGVSKLLLPSQLNVLSKTA